MPPVTFHFEGSTWCFRLAAYARGLLRRRLLFVLLVVALFPAAIDVGVSYALGESPDWARDVVLGFFALGGVILFGAVISALRISPAFSVTFSDAGIQERVGDRVHDHTWEWIEAVIDDGQSLTLYCRQRLKSFTVASEHHRTLVIDKRKPEVAELKRWLAARGHGE